MKYPIPHVQSEMTASIANHVSVLLKLQKLGWYWLHKPNENSDQN